MLLCFYFLLNLQIVFSIFHTKGEYKEWTPNTAHRTNLRCPFDWCSSKYPLKHIEHCCVCNSLPYWELTGEVIDVSLEYTRRSMSAELVGQNGSLCRLRHVGEMLTELPSNMCDFPCLVEIVLRRNNLISISNISCLKNLDTLDLSYNRIRHISNTTFVGMKNLRILKLSNNGVTSLDTYTLTGSSLFLYLVDLSSNNLEKLDISNIIPENNFCRYDFTSNKITDFINENNFELDLDKVYNGGFVDLIGNNFTGFLNFEDLGVDGVTLGKIFNFGFSMLDVKWQCDCRMEPYLRLTELTIANMWRDYYDIKCDTPEDLKGELVVSIAKERRYDELICNLTETQKCPRNCYCIDQPSRNRTIVNCNNMDWEKMPSYMPERANIELHLQNNKISYFDFRNYLINVSVIDISLNDLTNVSDKAINALVKHINISFINNKFNQLRRSLQTLHPCKTRFGKITIRCDCDSHWIGDWLRNRHAHECINETEIICKTDAGYGTIPGLEVTKQNVCEGDNNVFHVLTTLLGITFSLVLGITGVIYTFRYEIYLLKRKFLPNKINLKKITGCLKYDAYVSFDDDHAEVRKWVVQIFGKHLLTRGYKTFVPCRDMLSGISRQEDMAEKISCSKNFIVILSESFLSKDNIWTEKEWRYIWHHYKNSCSKNIIIINFCQLDCGFIQNAKMKAFVRLGLDLDFANKTHRLMKDVILKLGSPLFQMRIQQGRNKKEKFDSRKLLLKYKASDQKCNINYDQSFETQQDTFRLNL